MFTMSRLLRCSLILAASLFSFTSSAKSYKGAEVYSNQSYQYGRYEIRMRMAKASGTLSTFFTYKNGSEVAGTFWEEIDLEVFGKNDATQWQSNIILGSPRITTEMVHTADASLGDAYHTYVLEWTPDYVAWYLDGTVVRRIDGTSTVTSLTHEQTVRFNLWSSEAESWVGAWDDSVLPVYQFINYIDYKAYNATTKTFEGGWRDDFNSFDSSRWGKGDWTFDQNRVDFLPDNAVVKNGILVLALTKDNATGFSGTPPADNTASSSSQASSSVASSSSSSAANVASSMQTSSASTSHKSSGGGSVGWALLLMLCGFVIRLRP